MPDTSSTAARRWSVGWRDLGGQTRLNPLDGYRRLPEYGPHVYKPATGEAVIFSCSMLHEAPDVTKGERYVLLALSLRRRRRAAESGNGPADGAGGRLTRALRRRTGCRYAHRPLRAFAPVAQLGEAGTAKGPVDLLPAERRARGEPDQGEGPANLRPGERARPDGAPWSF